MDDRQAAHRGDGGWGLSDINMQRIDVESTSAEMWHLTIDNAGIKNEMGFRKSRFGFRTFLIQGNSTWLHSASHQLVTAILIILEIGAFPIVQK